jgi:L-alanine-DL-glutamate epimerase-like enolase superfamily enzyme
MGKYADPFLLQRILAELDQAEPGNTAAKAAVDIALHDWLGKKMGQPWYRIWGLDPVDIPPTSFTIAIDTANAVRQQAQDAAGFKVLKVKLGRDNDREMIAAIRDVSDVPIRVDVNQGWHDRSLALENICWLAERNVELVEQPLPKERLDDIAWLKERSPLPIVGDESVQRLADVVAARDLYHGVNIKLMKCTGMREAHTMMLLARSLGLKVMLGCMTETSCAISAAAHLAPLADWVDLDGALLISNDPFDGARLTDGRIVPTGRPGIGVVPRKSVGPGA